MSLDQARTFMNIRTVTHKISYRKRLFIIHWIYKIYTKNVSSFWAQYYWKINYYFNFVNCFTIHIYFFMPDLARRAMLAYKLDLNVRKLLVTCYQTVYYFTNCNMQYCFNESYYYYCLLLFHPKLKFIN